MKDGMDYAEMLGLEVSSCDVTIKPKKTRRKKDVVNDVIKKVNAPENADGSEFETIEIPEKTNKKSGEKKFRFDVIYAEGVTVFLLVVTILLTNIFWENSGINRIFKNAFGTAAAVTDTRVNTSFNAQAPSGELEEIGRAHV